MLQDRANSLPGAVLAHQDTGSLGIPGSGEWARRGSTLLQRDTSSSLLLIVCFHFLCTKDCPFN